MADLGSVATDHSGQTDTIAVLTIRVALPARLLAVSGIVYDDAATPCARTVRAYRRSDGVLVDETISNAGTGAYALECTADEVYRVVLDDAAGTLYNDLIDRVLPG